MKYYLVENENASNHWPFLDVKDQVVLDLGCGRWYTEDINEYTPVYFKNNGASRVIGVDGSGACIDYFKQIYANDNSCIFIEALINTKAEFLNLVQTYNPTVIKCDIEGSEQLFQDVTLNEISSVYEIAIEYHTLDLKMMLYEKFNEWGFKIKSDIMMNNAFQIHPMGVLHYHR